MDQLNPNETRYSAATAITPERRERALRELNRRPIRLGFFWEWSKTLVIAVVIFLFVRTFFVEAFKIPTGSMENTLLVGDFLLVNKVIYGAEIPFTGRSLPAVRKPEVGDVIVFVYPNDVNKNYVKRVVGAAGDTLEMRDGIVLRNGARLSEDYAVRTQPRDDPAGEDFRWQRDHLVRRAEATVGFHPSRNNWGPLVVPEENYFVLGDNRDNSHDSRYWGFVPDSLVKGRPMFVYYSYELQGSESAGGFLSSVRWQRIGHRIR